MIAFRKARTPKDREIHTAIADGNLIVRDTLSPALVAKIRNALITSPQSEDHIKDFLRTYR